MINFEELNQENHDISEHSRVLSYLIENRLICDTDIFCRLFYDYIDKVCQHLSVRDQALYTPLLNSGEQRTTNMVTNFMNGSKEIKRLIDKYKRHWCHASTKSLRIKDHEQFVTETNALFDMVLGRIQDEQEKMYPELRKIQAGETA